MLLWPELNGKSKLNSLKNAKEVFTHSKLGFDKVAEASFIEYYFRFRGVFLDSGSQAVDTQFEQFSIILVVRPPDTLKQFGGAAYPSLILDQMKKESILNRSQLNSPSSDPYLASVIIYGQLTIEERAKIVSLRGAAAENSIDLGNKFHGDKR